MGFVHVRRDDDGTPVPGWPKATIVLEHLEPGEGPFARVTWRMLEDLGYEAFDGDDASPRFYVAPAHRVGESTDLASVPPWLWGVVASFGRHTLAALLHDHLCDEASKVLPPGSARRRREADRLFRMGMFDLDVPAPRAWVMWAAVRLFGEATQPGLVPKVPLVAVLGASFGAWAAVAAGAAASPASGAIAVAALVVILVAAGLSGSRRRFDLTGAVLIGAAAGPLVMPALAVSFVTVLVLDEPALLDWATRKLASKLPRSPVADPGAIPKIGPQHTR